MTLPKNLQEKRDELSERYSSMSYPALTRMHMSQDFQSGFNSACNLLLPEIEKILKKNSIYPKDLQEWNEFLEGGE